MVKKHYDDDVERYHFYGFGNEGCVILRENHVEIDGKAFLNKWNQKIPYSELRPNFITMRSRSPMQPLAWMFVLLAGCCTVWLAFQLATLSVFSISRLVWTIICLWGTVSMGKRLFDSVLDWVIFPTTVKGQHVAFSRTGPHAENVDHFTNQLVDRISAVN